MIVQYLNYEICLHYSLTNINILIFLLYFQPSCTSPSLPLIHPCMREYSSVHTQQPAGPIREYKVDPYILVDDDLKYIFEDIRQVSIFIFVFFVLKP